jgi:hypothetical protein
MTRDQFENIEGLRHGDARRCHPGRIFRLGITAGQFTVIPVDEMFAK